MNQLSSCPLDLYYEEPQPPQLDLVTIIGRGRRVQRRRTASWAAGTLAACAAVASVVAGVGDITGRPAAGPSWPPLRASLPIDPLVAANPPVNGVLTLISGSPRHWTTVAWATRHGYVCWASFRTPMIGDSYDVQCPAWSPAQLPGVRPSHALGPLTLGISPAYSQRLGRWPVLGLVSPQAVSVRISADGFSSTVSVARVPVRGGKFVGVFVIWSAPLDITSRFQVSSQETAIGSGGRIIARLRHLTLSG